MKKILTITASFLAASALMVTPTMSQAKNNIHQGYQRAKAKTTGKKIKINNKVQFCDGTHIKIINNTMDTIYVYIPLSGDEMPLYGRGSDQNIDYIDSDDCYYPGLKVVIFDSFHDIIFSGLLNDGDVYSVDGIFKKKS